MTLPSAPRPPRRAFSLVEVLIAILILALGLLGLGALFPVVVREQRIGTEQIVGTIAANSAKAQLGSLSNYIWPISHPEPFWRYFRETLRQTNPPSAYTQGAWFVPSVEVNGTTAARGIPYVTHLRVDFNNESGAGGPVPPASDVFLDIPLSARLYPSLGSTEDPQFAWDIAVQRVPDGDLPSNRDAVRRSLDDQLRVAIFVRRIDQRIRVPSGYTLRQFLTDPTVPRSDRRAPFGIDTSGSRPVLTGNGTGDYAIPRIVNVRVEFDPDAAATAPEAQRRRDRLYFDNTRSGYAGSLQGDPDDNWAFASQVGQKLVDNLGNIYTVKRAGEDNVGQFVVIDPPLPAVATAYLSAPSNPQTIKIYQVVFTPQIPAAVELWTVRP